MKHQWLVSRLFVTIVVTLIRCFSSFMDCLAKTQQCMHLSVMQHAVARRRGVVELLIKYIRYCLL